MVPGHITTRCPSPPAHRVNGLCRDVWPTAQQLVTVVRRLPRVIAARKAALT